MSAKRSIIHSLWIAHKDLLEFSRKDQQDFELVNLHVILNKVYTLMAHQMKIADVNFRTDFTADKPIGMLLGIKIV